MLCVLCPSLMLAGEENRATKFAQVKLSPKEQTLRLIEKAFRYHNSCSFLGNGK